MALLKIPAVRALSKPPAPQKATRVTAVAGPIAGRAVGVAEIPHPRAVFRPVKENDKMSHWSGK